MKVEEAHLFPNTAPNGPGGFKAMVTVSVALAEETIDEAIAALEDALSPFTPVAEEAEEKPEEKPKRTRSRAKKEEKEAEPEKPKRTRRGKKKEEEEFDGPSAEDVARVASEAAEELGTKLTEEIVGDFSDSGKIEDIPPEKRQEFIDEINYNLDEDEDGDD